MAVGALSDARDAKHIAPGIVTCTSQAHSVSLRQGNVWICCRVRREHNEIYMNHTRRSYSRRFWSKDFDTFVWNGPKLTIEKVQRIPAKKNILGTCICVRKEYKKGIEHNKKVKNSVLEFLMPLVVIC